MSQRCRTQYPYPSRETSPALAIPSFDALDPVRVGELSFLCIRRAECVGGILQSAKANSFEDRKSTRLNSSHGYISYAVFCLKKKDGTLSVVDGKAADRY